LLSPKVSSPLLCSLPAKFSLPALFAPICLTPGSCLRQHALAPLGGSLPGELVGSLGRLSSLARLTL
jgi:hypothetical protein